MGSFEHAKIYNNFINKLLQYRTSYWAVFSHPTGFTHDIAKAFGAFTLLLAPPPPPLTHSPKK